MSTRRVPPEQRLREERRFFTTDEILDIAQWAFQGKSSRWVGEQFNPPRAASVIWNVAKKHGITFRGECGAPKGGHTKTEFTPERASAIQKRRWKHIDIKKNGFGSKHLVVEEEPKPSPPKPYVSIFDMPRIKR